MTRYFKKFLSQFHSLITIYIVRNPYEIRENSSVISKN